MGKFIIRIDRIIYLREIAIELVSYFSNIEMRLEVNLLELLNPVRITNMPHQENFPLTSTRVHLVTPLNFLMYDDIY